MALGYSHRSGAAASPEIVAGSGTRSVDRLMGRPRGAEETRRILSEKEMYIMKKLLKAIGMSIVEGCVAYAEVYGNVMPIVK